MEQFISWKEKEGLNNYVYFSKLYKESTSDNFKNTLFVNMTVKTELTERNMNQQEKVIKFISMGKSRQVCFVLQGYLLNKFYQKKKKKKTVNVEYIFTHSHKVSIANTKFQPIPPTIKKDIKK